MLNKIKFYLKFSALTALFAFNPVDWGFSTHFYSDDFDLLSVGFTFGPLRVYADIPRYDLNA